MNRIVEFFFTIDIEEFFWTFIFVSMQKNEFVINASGLKEKAIQNTITLLEGGATVPFISRYRKEMTGGLDEVQIAQIRDLAKKYDEIISRQQTMIASI